MRTPELVEILKFLKQTLPTINRITSYCRAKTAALKKPEELKAIHEAGLTRLHIGLESGSDTVLKMIDKGVTAAEEIEGGKKWWLRGFLFRSIICWVSEARHYGGNTPLKAPGF
jgi:radical SAM superfamily enzyme YgiQ (UPF0313 family)